MGINDWNNLSLSDKAEIIRVAIDNGITTLPEIKNAYNEFSEGGYLNWFTQLAEKKSKEWGVSFERAYQQLLNDDYDYKTFYDKDRNMAEGMLTSKPDAHFSDVGKTPSHPTFSDESAYSREGFKGGHWGEGPWGTNSSTYQLSQDQLNHNWDIDRTINYLSEAEDNGVAVKMPNGHLVSYADGSIFGGVLPAVKVQSKVPLEKNLYWKGGYTSSDAIRNKISQWEGTSMYAPAPDTGKVNRSFEEEEKSFEAVLPSDIKKQVLSNQDLADHLFSYSYNVGATAFKKRVVPALQNYYKGKGTIEAITQSMVAAKDKDLKGLRKRRAVERQGVIDALTRDRGKTDLIRGLEERPHWEPIPIVPTSSTASTGPLVLPSQEKSVLPINPVEAAYVYNPQQERMENLQRLSSVMGMMGMENPLSNTLGMIQDLNTNPLMAMANHYAYGG